MVGIFLLLALLEALFGRQFSWWKVTFFFVFHFFCSIWLIVKWCIVLLLHPYLVFFRVSSSISHFGFPLHGSAMNRGGVLVVVRRYAKYSRPSLLPLLLIPLSPCVVRDRGRQESINLYCLPEFIW